MDQKRPELEDDFQNFWSFVKLEARRLSLLTYKVELVEKTLFEILSEIKQRPIVSEEKISNYLSSFPRKLVAS
jgi:hypothetical protein